MTGAGENIKANTLLLEGVSRRLDEMIKLLRRIDLRLTGSRVPDDLKDLVFDETSPNGRVI